MAKRVNLLEGNILSALTRLALPIMATSLVNMAYNMTDMIWIGRVGPGPVAAVGAAGMYMWLSQGLAVLARMGGQVKVCLLYTSFSPCIAPCPMGPLRLLIVPIPPLKAGIMPVSYTHLDVYKRQHLELVKNDCQI